MFSALLISLLIGLSPQDASPQLVPRPLKASSTHLSQAPLFGAVGVIQCDANSNVYYHLYTVSYRRTEIMRLSMSDDKSILYKLPNDLADTMSFIDFSVSQDGDVNLLVGDQEFRPIVFSFNSEGGVSSHVTLEVPEHMIGEHIAVFPNGTMLFYGFYGRQADKELVGKRFVGLFKPSGQLLKRLDKLDLGEMNIEQRSTRLPEGGAIIGRDGNAYLLTADKMLVVSSSGEIQRIFPFKKPDPEFVAASLQYSDGLLAISFAKPATKPNLLFLYLVINASNGDPLGLYEPTDETGNSNVCFSRHDGFLFDTVKNGRAVFVTAPLR